MAKHYSPYEGKKKRSEILGILDESFAMQLRPMRVIPEDIYWKLAKWEDKYKEMPLSVAVVIIAPRYNTETKKAEAILIKERNSYDPSKLTIKFPSGGMTIEDKDLVAAAIREFRMETGYEARNINFCFAAEYSSTHDNERHVKVFFIAKDHEEVGLPTEKDIEEVVWCEFVKIGKAITIPRNQRIAMKPIHDKVMGISSEIMLDLYHEGNRFPEPMEGET